MNINAESCHGTAPTFHKTILRAVPTNLYMHYNAIFTTQKIRKKEIKIMGERGQGAFESQDNSGSRS